MKPSTLLMIGGAALLVLYFMKNKSSAPSGAGSNGNAPGGAGGSGGYVPGFDVKTPYDQIVLLPGSQLSNGPISNANLNLNG